MILSPERQPGPAIGQQRGPAPQRGGHSGQLARHLLAGEVLLEGGLEDDERLVHVVELGRDDRRAARAGGLCRCRRAPARQGERRRGARSVAPRVLARDAGGAAGGAAPVPVDGGRARGPALRQHGPRKLGPRHQRPELLLSGLQRAARGRRRPAHRQQRQAPEPQRDGTGMAQRPGGLPRPRGRVLLVGRLPVHHQPRAQRRHGECRLGPGARRRPRRPGHAQPAPGRHDARGHRRAPRLLHLCRRPRASPDRASACPLPRPGRDRRLGPRRALRPLPRGRAPLRPLRRPALAGAAADGGLSRPDLARDHDRPRPRFRRYQVARSRRKRCRCGGHLDRRARARHAAARRGA